MSKLRVRFDAPEHGWIGITVSDRSSQVVIDVASHYASFYTLINGLVLLAQDQRIFSMTWQEEPVETEWVFARSQEKITFLIIRTRVTEPDFSFSGSYQEVCFPFWRALQSLKGRYTKEELEARLHDAFPYPELEQLTAIIEQMKTRA